MRVNATTEQLEYLASLGVSVGTPTATASPNTISVVQTPSVTAPCQPASQQAESIPVALSAPAPERSWWKENAVWISILGSTTAVLLMLILVLLIKG